MRGNTLIDIYCVKIKSDQLIPWSIDLGCNLLIGKFTFSRVAPKISDFFLDSLINLSKNSITHLIFQLKLIKSLWKTFLLFFSLIFYLMIFLNFTWSVPFFGFLLLLYGVFEFSIKDKNLWIITEKSVKSRIVPEISRKWKFRKLANFTGNFQILSELYICISFILTSLKMLILIIQTSRSDVQVPISYSRSLRPWFAI